MFETKPDSDAIQKQIAEHYSFARQHINIVCTAFLAFSTLNATFAKLSIDFPSKQEKEFFVSTIICFGFFIGNLAGVGVFRGAAIQLNACYEAVRYLLSQLPVRNHVQINELRRQPLSWPSGYSFLLKTVLRGLNRSRAVDVDPLNAIPVDDYCATFGIFAIVCLVASVVWFGQFLVLMIRP